MPYDFIFASSQGFVSGKTYYAQIIQLQSAYFWDTNAKALAQNPTYANTDISINEPVTCGIFAVDIPGDLPAGKYKIYIREQAGVSVAATDNIVYEKTFDKRSDGAVFFIELGTTVY